MECFGIMVYTKKDWDLIPSPADIKKEIDYGENTTQTNVLQC